MRIVIIFFLLSITAPLVLASESVTNYSDPKSVLDFEVRSDTVWVATSGGLYIHDRETSTGTLLASTVSSPDPHLTAVCRDSEGNIWSGSHQGFLTKRSPRGKVLSSISYSSAKWRISDLVSYKNYLFVGSLRGISVFDKVKMIAVKNAIGFGSSSVAQVNAMAVFKDTLFVGLENGTAKLDIAAGKLENENFYDPSIWTVDSSSAEPVRCFAVVSDKMRAFYEPAAVFKGKLLEADSCALLYNGETIFTFPSRITSIKVNGSEDVWIGTEENFYYSWDEVELKNFTVPGLSFTYVNRIHVDNSGTLWALPRFKGGQMPWWRGINSFTAGTWNHYSPVYIPQMGHFGDHPDNRGIAQSSDGRMWFGTSGGQVKTFDPSVNGWSRFCIFAPNSNEGKFSHSEITCPAPDWAKSDAIAQDLSGYMWISSWNELFGALICYDPRYEPDPEQTDPVKAHYRSFFQQSDVNFSEKIKSLSVDNEGRIIAGSEGGKVVVFRHNGSPLEKGINILNTFTETGNVNDIVSTPEGITLIATMDGLFSYDPDQNNLTEIENIGSVIMALEVEDRSTVWMATPGQGVIRYNLSNGTRSQLTKTHGLISDQVADLALDRAKGYLWVATDLGLSRLSIGYNLTASSTSSIIVYPNPFNRSRHSQVYFRNLPPGSKVMIHSVSGELVAKAKLVREGNEGAYFSWNPSDRIVPGTYFYSVRAEGYSPKAGKILISP